jgi:hypothetical protein
VSPQPELVFEGKKIRIERHSEPPAGFLEQLARTIWGTGGVKYAMLDIAERLPKPAGSQFFALREDGVLAGAYALAPRVLCVQGRGVPGLDRTLPNPAQPEPTRLPGLQAPDPRLQEKQFLEPGVWSLKSLPSCARLPC